MPGVDGLAVCRRLRAKGMTTLGADADRARRRGRPRARPRGRGRRLPGQAVRDRGAGRAPARPGAPRARRARPPRVRRPRARPADAHRATRRALGSSSPRARRALLELLLRIRAGRASRASARSRRCGTRRPCPTWSTATSRACAASSASRRSSTPCAAWGSCCVRETAHVAGPADRGRLARRRSSPSLVLFGVRASALTAQQLHSSLDSNLRRSAPSTSPASACRPPPC